MRHPPPTQDILCCLGINNFVFPLYIANYVLFNVFTHFRNVICIAI